MNATVSNILRWTAVIGFLILPPVLVRSSSNGAAIRIVIYCVLLVTLTLWCAYIGFKRGSLVADMPIAKDLKTDKSRRIAEIFFRGLPLIFLVAGSAMMVEFVPSLLLYASNQTTAVTEVRAIKQINSPAVPGAFYMYMSILADDKKYISFWYPDMILQSGHTYLFTLLPNSDFVLEAKEVNQKNYQ